MPFVKGHIPWTKGKKLSEEIKRKISFSQKGRHHSFETEFKKAHPSTNTEEVRKKISKALKGRQPKNSLYWKKEKHPNWKGGVTSKKKTIRESIEYRLWREAVFARDNWTCQSCGRVGGELHADHIKMFAYHLDIRFAIDNGRTLCRSCHGKLPTSRKGKHVCC